MRLVKGGRVVEDRFVRVLDDAPIPDGVAVLIPAARFLADADEIAGREAPTGILWPNNRRVVEFEEIKDETAAQLIVAALHEGTIEARQTAAAALGYPDVRALQTAIRTFCQADAQPR